MVTLLGKAVQAIVKALAGKKEEKKTTPAIQHKKQMRQELAAAAQALGDKLFIYYDPAKRRVERYLQQEKNPLVEMIYKTVDEYVQLGKKSSTGPNIWTATLMLALADAIEKNRHKDPDTLINYILGYLLASMKQAEKLPHLDRIEEIWGLYPYDIQRPIRAVHVLSIALEKAGLKDKADILYTVHNEIPVTARRRPHLYAEAKVIRLKERGFNVEPYYREVLQELQNIETTGRILEETTRHAEKMLALAALERLPGWVIKLGLDQYKTPLYVSHEGVHPALIKYHIERASPESEKGALLHTLITRVLSEWEREVSRGEEPSHPREIIDKLLGRRFWEYSTRTPREDLQGKNEFQDVVNALGLPSTLTPQQVRKVVEELYRDLHDLYLEKESPHKLDAEKEAALRYAQLKPLAGNTVPADIDIPTIISKNKNIILEKYKNIKQSLLEEIQVGKEEEEKLLTKLEQRLPILIDSLVESLQKGERISSAVSKLTENLNRELEKEVPERSDRAWLVNFARNILLDTPIIAVAQDPETMWKGSEEKRRIAAALAKLYEDEGKKHRLAPVTTDMHWMWESIKKKEDKEERLQEIIRWRNVVNAVKAVSGDAYRLFHGLMDAKWYNEKGLLRPQIINELNNAKVKLLEATYPRIRIKEKVA